MCFKREDFQRTQLVPVCLYVFEGSVSQPGFERSTLFHARHILPPLILSNFLLPTDCTYCPSSEPEKQPLVRAVLSVTDTRDELLLHLQNPEKSSFLFSISKEDGCLCSLRASLVTSVRIL